MLLFISEKSIFVRISVALLFDVVMSKRTAYHINRPVLNPRRGIFKME